MVFYGGSRGERNGSNKSVYMTAKDSRSAGAVFGTRVHREMKRLGISQGQLAAACGCSQPVISDLIKGKTPDPKAATVVRITQALKMRPEDLFEVFGDRDKTGPSISPLLLPESGAPDAKEDYVLLSGGGLTKRVSLQGFLDEIILPAFRKAGYRVSREGEAEESPLASDVRLLKAKVEALQTLFGDAMRVQAAARRGTKATTPTLRLLQASESPNQSDRSEDK